MKKMFPFVVGCLLMVLPILMQAQTNQKNDFYNVEEVRTIKITLKQKKWTDMLDSLKVRGDEMLLGTAEIDGKIYENIGIRYRGDKSFQIGGQRNAFHIKLDHHNKTQNHLGHTTLKLSNALRDPSMLREVLAYEIARKYMPAPRANFIKVFINNDYRGLYVNIEDIDDAFLQKYFGDAQGSFIKCMPVEHPEPIADCKKGIYASLEWEENPKCYENNYQSKSPDGLKDLIELTRVLNKNTADIASVLNIDRVLWMLAFNNALVNLSSYTGNNSQNYYLYRDSTGHFNPIIWDLNLAFGSYKNVENGKSSLELKQLQQLDPFVHEKNEQKPLISKILEVPAFRQVYLAHLRTIMAENFINGEYDRRARQLQAKINGDVANDRYKTYTQAEFLAAIDKTTGKKSKIPGIAELMSKRVKFLDKHPETQLIAPDLSNLKVAHRQKFGQTVTNFIITAQLGKAAKTARIYYRFATTENYQMGLMKDDGASHDGAANDKVFGIQIDPPKGQKVVEYYIVAENAAAISFHPSRYMFEPYKANLDELNK